MESTGQKQLIQSFTSLHGCLNRPRIARQVIITLLVIHTCLLVGTASVHSPTLNEPGHLVAGLAHWKFGRFELYRVNPPLVRMVAALPVMAVGYEEDWSGYHDSPGTRPVFNLGEDFVRANGERSFFLFMIARWACIPFSWIGAIVCYLWARDLWGRPSGVMACTFWCFSPNILGHASLITADIHATALGIAACYTFWRWLKSPTWWQAAITGVVLGSAELAKTTLILFYPLWPLLWIAYRWTDRHRMQVRDWVREAGMLLLRMAIGLYVLNLGYSFEDSCQPLKDFHFFSTLLTGQDTDEENAAGKQQPAAEAALTNRFAGAWYGNLPVPFPGNYVRGIDLQQRDFENFRRPSYLRGHWQDRGWWYYYLYAVAIKVPVGTLLAGILAIVFRTLEAPARAGIRDELILLVPPLIIFLVVSSKTGFSHHMRYVYPCFPFIFVWISRTAWALVCLTKTDHAGPQSAFRSTLILPTCVSFGIVWSVCSSLWVSPHSLSYFNELAGGPGGGANHLLNSNIDWGQDLLFLREWMNEHADDLHAEPFHLAYYGYFDPADVGFSEVLPWPAPASPNRSSSEPENEHVESSLQLRPGYYAISVNLLKGFPWTARDGLQSERLPAQFNPLSERLDDSLLDYFRNRKPCGRAGYSILIFYVSDEASVGDRIQTIGIDTSQNDVALIDFTLHCAFV